MKSTCTGEAADFSSSDDERRQGFGVQEWPDGSKYEGEFVEGLKHGKGRYTSRNGEYYEGFFYKDFKHGDAVYCWPTGHTFTGKFYLNRKEGYGHFSFPGGAVFQGLYHRDQRFGPGVFTYPDGRQDVGLWHGQRLLKLCSSLGIGFSLQHFPEYAAFMKPHVHEALIQVGIDKDLLLDESFILPPGIERYSIDGDHLPLTPGRRKELDRLFHGELWEQDAPSYQGYEREPLSALPLHAHMQAHIHRHRLQAENIGWDVAAVLSMNRDNFGPKGPLEVSSEQLIQHSFRGDLRAVSQIFLTDSVCPDVADSQGQTALIAATINCHNEVIHRLLDIGANIDQLNREGMSALAVCHVLYYPFQSLHTTLIHPPTRAQVLTFPPSENRAQNNQADVTLETQVLNKEPQAKHTNMMDENIVSQPSKLASEELPVHFSHGRIEEVTSDPDHLCEKERPEKGEDESYEDREKVRSAHNYDIAVTEGMLQHSAKALNRPQQCHLKETARKMAAMQIERHVRLDTLKLLLDRGADPNLCRVPMPVLFLATMAGDAEVIRKLLLCGACTDIPLPTEEKGFYPLHAAAALPGSKGPEVTELLLHAITNPDAQACDQDEIYAPNLISMKDNEDQDSGLNLHLTEGGRTALHIACQRESDYLNACKVVALLLSHRARTDLLWSGHSPLSLAISSGNDLAVDELLKGGTDPNLPLGNRVGSALCTLTNFSYPLCGNRIKLLKKLAKAGANVSMPIRVGKWVGTAVDFAHYSVQQDQCRIRGISILNREERKLLDARRHLLDQMTSLFRMTIRTVYKSDVSLDSPAHGSEGKSEAAKSHRQPVLKFCCHCGLSASVKLTACRRCLKVFFCSVAWQEKTWVERHMKKCFKMSGGNQQIFSQQPKPRKT
ncbi:PREDICTED: ankyrin repeat and MYND domain-containing protein 1 [Cyprinodon variegatus]|uniref:ankyrin repeat and MYND domain-containing protein 1 n=1 Tax=Cyprinodon variegatus TaxID=28743 RepID=UPI000742537D|nr:PREDICTED: ankyrin repeat and MYND domain-containing protein 1 [Cyprinodon variegatus]